MLNILENSLVARGLWYCVDILLIIIIISANTLVDVQVFDQIYENFDHALNKHNNILYILN